MKLDKTSRGFPVLTFRDRYDAECSMQVSSLATESCVWLGMDNPTIMRGVMPLPKEEAEAGQLRALGRMHVDRRLATDLVAVLAHWLAHDEIVTPEVARKAAVK